MGIFQLFAMLVETGGWLPTTVRIWVGDYGMLKPPRSCCCRSFGWEKSWKGFFGVLGLICCSCRKTHPKDITVHAWMLLWFVWIEILGGLDSVEDFPKTFDSESGFLKHWPQEGHSRPVYGDSVARVVNEFPTVIWYQNDKAHSHLSPGRESIFVVYLPTNCHERIFSKIWIGI